MIVGGALIDLRVLELLEQVETTKITNGTNTNCKEK